MKQANRLKNLLICSILLLFAFGSTQENSAPSLSPYIIVLGVAQDAGYPQADCQRACCRPAWKHAELRRHVACLGIVDPVTGERWMIDATPDFKDQLQALNRQAPNRDDRPLSGVLLTHAHIGHYTGLMYLGFEAIGAKSVPVYAMPRMREYLSTSGPWSQLVRLHNIELRPLEDGAEIALNARIRVRPFRVPHRDEYSETVGFEIIGPEKCVVYIPDIDKWEKWDTQIETVIGRCDRAFLDGSFFLNDEVQGRDMSIFPHPFIVESMARFSPLPDSEKQKITFIHFNHTNPVLDEDSEQARAVRDRGYRIAIEGEKIPL